MRLVPHNHTDVNNLFNHKLIVDLMLIMWDNISNNNHNWRVPNIRIYLWSIHWYTYTTFPNILTSLKNDHIQYNYVWILCTLNKLLSTSHSLTQNCPHKVIGTLLIHTYPTMLYTCPIISSPPLYLITMLIHVSENVDTLNLISTS